MNKTLSILCACFFLSLPNSHCASPGTAIFPILKVEPSAYSAALGGVNGIISAQAVLNNPAVLPFIGEGTISAQHLLYLNDVTYSMLTYLHPINEEKALSASAGYVGAGGLVRTIYDSTSLDQYKEAGSFDFSDAIFNMSYGQRISDNFSFGAGLKGIRENLDGKDSYGAMLSMSGFYIPQNGVEVNFGFINLGPQVSGYDLPLGGYLGLVNRISYETTWLGEVIGYNDQIVEFRTGLDYNVSGLFSLRVGYKHPLKDQGLGTFPSINLTGGFGLRIGGITIDYAWVPYGDLGVTHRIAIGARIGANINKDYFSGINSYKEAEDHSAAKKAKQAEAANKFKQLKDTKKVNIAVVDFLNKNTSSVDASIITDFVRSYMVQTGLYSVVDRDNMNMILEEQQFQSSGCSSQDCAVKMGKILNVNQVIIGSYSRISGMHYVALNVVDVETGEIVKTVVQDIEDTKDLKNICKTLVNKIIPNR